MTEHRRFLKLAASAIDFGLAPTERTELDRHVDGCTDCRRASSAFGDQAFLLRDRPRATVPATLRQRVGAEWLSGGTRPRSRDAFRLAILAAAALIAIVGLAAVGVGVDRHQQVASPSPVSAPPSPSAALPQIGATRSLAVPAGDAAHEHLCHVIVASDCAADVLFAADSVWTTTSDGVVRLDTTTEVIVAQVTVGAFPHRLAFAASSLWVTVVDPGELVRVDPITNTVVARVAISSSPGGLAASADGVWVVDPGASAILHVDASTNSIDSSIPIDDAPTDIVMADGALWVTHGARSLSRIDLASNRVTMTIELPGFDEVSDVKAALGRIWVVGHDNIKTYDPISGEAIEIHVPNFPRLAIDGSNVWVVSGWNRVVQQLDPGSGSIVSQQTLPTNQTNWDMPVAVGAGSIWIRDYDGDRLLRINPSP